MRSPALVNFFLAQLSYYPCRILLFPKRVTGLKSYGVALAFKKKQGFRQKTDT
jgi:hypothetical protein